MENVAARRRGAILELPVAPHFRLEKEIKNVITVIAKTCHYWLGHMPREQQQAIAELFVTMAGESPLLEPDLSSRRRTRRAARVAKLDSARALDFSDRTIAIPGWLGIECPSVRAAVWMMRALVASNVLSRREGTVLFVPVNPATDPHGTIAARTFVDVYRCASASASASTCEQVRRRPTTVPTSDRPSILDRIAIADRTRRQDFAV